MITPYKSTDIRNQQRPERRRRHKLHALHRKRRVYIEHVIKEIKTFRAIGSLNIYRHFRWHMSCLVELCAGLSKKRTDILNTDRWIKYLWNLYYLLFVRNIYSSFWNITWNNYSPCTISNIDIYWDWIKYSLYQVMWSVKLSNRIQVAWITTTVARTVLNNKQTFIPYYQIPVYKSLTWKNINSANEREKNMTESNQQKLTNLAWLNTLVSLHNIWKNKMLLEYTFLWWKAPITDLKLPPGTESLIFLHTKLPCGYPRTFNVFG